MNATPPANAPSLADLARSAFASMGMGDDDEVKRTKQSTHTSRITKGRNREKNRRRANSRRRRS